MTEKNPDYIVISRATREKVESAKNFIEQRYSKMLQQEQEKRQYWDQLNQKMQMLNLSSSEQQDLKRRINHEEAIQLRQERRKISIGDFTCIKIIGKGAFGEVRLCKWNPSNEAVAVKKLKKKDMICKNKVMQSREERNVLAISEKNPWVVNLKCSFQDFDSLYLVMEYLPGGDLMNLLMKKDIFTHEEAQFYTAEILMALDSVHKMKYIHRDLKPDNVLLDANGHIKLSDFGLCKHTQVRPNKLTDNLKKTETQLERGPGTSSNFTKEFHKRNNRKLAYSAVGTPDYVAPEVQGKMGYNETVDWWSMGVILFEMLVGYPPFASEEANQTWKKIQNWRSYLCIPTDANVSLTAADLIRKLIADSRDRLGVNGVEEIKAHPFFAGINWHNLREKRSPYIPEVKNCWDTRNFDAFQEEQPWQPSDGKGVRGRKKNTEFIGYTYKPLQQSNSALLKALIDLDTYKPPVSNNHLAYLQLDDAQLNRFKKDKTDRISKEMAATTMISTQQTLQTQHTKESERNKAHQAETPEKKGLKLNYKKPSQRQSPKQSSKQSPSTKDIEEKRMAVKILQKKKYM